MKKTNKPIIGIVSKPNTFCDEDLFTQQVIYDGVRCALINNGAIVIGLLPTQITNKFNLDDNFDNTKLTNQEISDLHDLIDICDGIVLQGGLSSSSYELEFAKYAIEKDIPLLGICAGFNNIVRAFGGNLFYIEGDNIHNQEDGRIVHKNRIIKNTLLYKILKKEEVAVNSLHIMFAKEEDIKGLNISAFSDDGYVEAVESSKNKFVLGVKWHPEMMNNFDDSMNMIFQEFICACKK